jgi:hypothetical protein
MKEKLAQKILKDSGFYTETIDGDFGKKSKEAAFKYYNFPTTWNGEKLVTGVIQVAAVRSNINIGNIDGLWGNMTQSAYEQLLKKDSLHVKKPDVSQSVDVKKHYNDWPKQDYNSMVKFYGAVGTNQTTLQLPYEMLLAWDLDSKVSKITCHEKVHDSLQRIFKNTLDHYGIDAIKELRLNRFGGVLNVRKMRGGSSWSKHCLPKGSPVWTPKGIVPIENISIGDYVYSFESGNLVTKKVKNFFENGKKPLVKVVVCGGDIDCSPEHKILVLKKKTLEPTEYIQHKNKNGQIRAKYWTEMVEAKDIIKGDKIVFLKKSIVDGDINWDSWYEILGMFIGDGCIHHRKGSPSYMSIQIPKSDRIRKHAEKLFDNYFGSENIKKNEKQFIINKRDIWERFLPYNKKSFDKDIPTEVWSSTIDQQRSFIRGYLYTDGCIIKSSRAVKHSFKCASYNLMLNLRLLLSLHGFRNSKLDKRNGGETEICGVKCNRRDGWMFTSVDTNNIFTCVEDIMYFDRVKDSKHNKGTSHCMGYEELFPDFIYKSVKDVKYLEKGLVDVFDIEVEDTHNFIVDGMVVSNSWGAAVDIDPDRNQLKWGKDKAFLARPEYEPFWKIVEAEGWTSLGKARNIDFMHFQAANL